MARGKKKESALTPEEKLAQALVSDWEFPYRVPDNWRWAILKACCKDVFSGKSPKYSKEPTDIRIIGQQANRRDGIDLSYVKYGTVDFAEAQEERMWLQKNDVLLNTLGSGTIGRSGIYKGSERLLTDGHLFVFRSNECYLPDLMYYYLCANEEKIINSANGSTNQKFLSLSAFSAFPLPVPPIAEQQRIVDRIEYLFVKLDEAKEKAQSVLDSFETRKAAILHKAFTGELTAKWRTEHSVKVESWDHTTVGAIAEVKGGKRVPKGMELTTENTGHPYIKAGNLKQGTVIDDGMMYVPDDVLPYIKNYTVQAGDVYITNVGACIGDCGVIPPKYDGANLTENAVKITNLRCNGDYLARFLASNTVQQNIKGLIASATLGKLSIANIKTIEINLPSLGEQVEIVRILDGLLTKEQQAKEAAEVVLEKIDLLKKSILARAFRGELGTNDPTEESAVELLKTVL